MQGVGFGEADAVIYSFTLGNTGSSSSAVIVGQRFLYIALLLPERMNDFVADTTDRTLNRLFLGGAGALIPCVNTILCGQRRIGKFLRLGLSQAAVWAWMYW
jgi:hypothetical protein